MNIQLMKHGIFPRKAWYVRAYSAIVPATFPYDFVHCRVGNDTENFVKWTRLSIEAK